MTLPSDCSRVAILLTWNVTNSRVQLPRQGNKQAECFQASRGRLILNADDWGRDRDTTERTLECILRGAVSSASAMVLMEDSERASVLAREHGIDAGLHLNFTTPFSAANCPARLV